MSKKYEVEINEKNGTLDNTLFEKMAKKGDITSIKVTECIGKEVSITGYAKCTIKTEDNEFDIVYYDTKEVGILSSGSEIFADSVFAYIGEVEKVRITEIKTKKGKTYKAVPILNSKKEETKTEVIEDLPF